jgi:hypothetical protein
VNRIPALLKWLTSSLVAIALLTVVFVIRGDGQAIPLADQITATPEPTQEVAESTQEVHNLMFALIGSDQKIVSVMAQSICSDWHMQDSLTVSVESLSCLTIFTG